MFDYATGKYAAGAVLQLCDEDVVDGGAEGYGDGAGGRAERGAGGMSYVQFARKGLALQRTQIGGGVRLAAADGSMWGIRGMGRAWEEGRRRRVSSMG